MTDALHAQLVRQGFETIETHISRVYLRGDDVYKLKRPVNLGFLDFTTAEARLAACLAEVELNRRLADGIYLGVVAVVQAEDGGLAFVPFDRPDASSVCDWAVHMKRLADADRADQLLARGAFDEGDIAAVAGRLQSFHAAARADAHTASFGAPEVVAANVEENFAQVASSIGRYLSESEREALIAFQRSFLTTHEELLRRRVACGRVRDGHGDLRLEHVYRTREHGYVMLDCIEFNERFRFADVCADLSFLAMDLSFHDRVDLAELLVAAYARESGDYELYALLDFYESYRACVRAKISSLLAEDQGVSALARDGAEHEARRYYLLALSAAQRPARPARLVAVLGVIASGKSTLAEALSRELAAPLLSADHTRKQLLGHDAGERLNERAFEGAYAPAVSERVYDTLFTRAEHVVGAGRTAIVDATFRTRERRDKLRQLARRLGAELLFVECTCPRELLRERLERRAKNPSVSDAGPELLEPFLASYEPCTELGANEHLRLDTSLSLAHNLDQLRERLG